MPALLIPLVVLQCKCEDGVPLLDCVFSLGIVGLESGVEGIEGLGGREGV